MLTRYFKGIATNSLLAMIVIAAGCSGSDRASVNSNGLLTSNVQNFFPLDEGSVKEFTVKSSNGAVNIVTFEVGAEIRVGNDLATEWFVYDGNGNKSTSFVLASPSLILFYEDINSQAETILKLPLEVGSSWERFGENTSNGGGDIFTGLINGGSDPKGLLDGNDTTSGGNKDGGNGSIDAGKNFPTDGANRMEVDKFETVVLSKGASYSNALKLKNGGLGGVNYYWFAAGVGLVKYVLGGQTDGSEAGATVGELTRITSR